MAIQVSLKQTLWPIWVGVATGGVYLLLSFLGLFFAASDPKDHGSGGGGRGLILMVLLFFWLIQTASDIHRQKVLEPRAIS